MSEVTKSNTTGQMNGAGATPSAAVLKYMEHMRQMMAVGQAFVDQDSVDADGQTSANFEQAVRALKNNYELTIQGGESNQTTYANISEGPLENFLIGRVKHMRTIDASGKQIWVDHNGYTASERVLEGI